MKSKDILKIENLRFNEQTYSIRWNVTKLCNYNCDFCIQGNKKRHIKDSKSESINIRNSICENIVKFIECDLNGKFKCLNLYLIGGEVFILKDFINILKKFVNSKFDGKINIYITSNLSLDKKMIEEVLNIFSGLKNRYLYLSASFYKSYQTEKDFFNKISLFNSKLFNNIYVKVYYPIINDLDYKSYLKINKKYKRYCNKIDYILIRNYKTDISDKLKKKLSKVKIMGKKIRVTFKNKKIYLNKTTDINLRLKEAFNPNGYLCDSGIYNISIDNLGNVSRCCSCKNESMVSNILNEKLKLIDNLFICPSKSCSCDYYKTIKKNVDILHK